ncbi:MAG: hypothetical protein QM809_18490 [Gordonia sp. (in: high G+C Gram-positive bacteria)]|uniref:lactonase family protein n=1 Tax=Gordonia sp. (in: high G+C Gram-positive bacteria) TaxID=84139 RepID=UPI0039E59E43
MRIRRSTLWLAVVLTALLTVGLLAPGSTRADEAKRHFLVTAGVALGLSVLEVHSDGRLTPVPGSPFRTGFGVLSVTAAPDGKTVYVPRADGHVSVYRVASNGALRSVQTLGVGFPTTGARVAPNGRYLYVLKSGLPGRVESFRIRKDGTLAPTGHRAAPIDGLGLGMVNMSSIDPDGRFLRATTYIGVGLTSFRLGPNGEVTRIAADTVGLGPVAPVTTPNGKYLYSSDEFAFGLSGFRVNRDGTLTRLPGGRYPTHGVPHGAVVTPDGRRLYVPNAVGTSISAFSIHRNGRLTPLPGSPYPGPGWTLPGQVALHPNGRFLYNIDCLTGRVTTRVHTYRIHPNGSLSRTARPSVDTGVVMSDGPVVALI